MVNFLLDWLELHCEVNRELKRDDNDRNDDFKKTIARLRRETS